MSAIVPFKVIFLLLSHLSQSRCYIHLRWSCYDDDHDDDDDEMRWGGNETGDQSEEICNKGSGQPAPTHLIHHQASLEAQLTFSQQMTWESRQKNCESSPAEPTTILSGHSHGTSPFSLWSNSLKFGNFLDSPSLRFLKTPSWLSFCLVLKKFFFLPYFPKWMVCGTWADNRYKMGLVGIKWFHGKLAMGIYITTTNLIQTLKLSAAKHWKG